MIYSNKKAKGKCLQKKIILKHLGIMSHLKNSAKPAINSVSNGKFSLETNFMHCNLNYTLHLSALLTSTLTADQ